MRCTEGGNRLPLLPMYQFERLRIRMRLVIAIGQEAMGRLLVLRGPSRGIDDQAGPIFPETDNTTMSLVTMGDRAKALLLLHGDIDPLTQRDRMLLSLARQTTWTEKQRALIEKMWDHQQGYRDSGVWG